MLKNLTDKEIFEAMNKFVEEHPEIIQDIHEEYCCDPQIGPMIHVRIVGSAIKFAKWVMEHDICDENDIHNVLLYLYVCINAMKDKLDWRQFRTDHNLEAIIYKCSTQDFERSKSQ